MPMAGFRLDEILNLSPMKRQQGEMRELLRPEEKQKGIVELV